uniref:Methyltransf_11 domain-containing protein n=1 Tax=Rhabditophanes sp. KR3021 TaxID=114890 RepID=A0AC35UHU6_9BILA
MDINFLNFGYLPTKNEMKLAVINEVIEVEDNQIAHCYLYEKTLSLCPKYKQLAGATILDVGCGHLGGIRWLKRAHPEIKSICGIDLVLPNKSNCFAFGEVKIGDALNIPYPSSSFDIIINIESSHLYSDFDKFLHEANRVLKLGGYICWSDLRFATRMRATLNSFDDAGFEMVKIEDITKQVIQGLAVTSKRYEKLLEKAPYFIRLFKNSVWRNTWTAPGTDSYKRFKKEKLYMSATFKKNQDIGAPSTQELSPEKFSRDSL